MPLFQVHEVKEFSPNKFVIKVPARTNRMCPEATNEITACAGALQKTEPSATNPTKVRTTPHRPSPPPRVCIASS